MATTSSPATAPNPTSSSTLPATTPNTTSKPTSSTSGSITKPLSIKLKLNTPRPFPSLIPVRFDRPPAGKTGQDASVTSTHAARVGLIGSAGRLGSTFRCIEVGDERVIAMHLERMGSTSTRGRTGVGSGSASRGENSVLREPASVVATQGPVGNGTISTQEVIPPPRPSKRKSMAQNPFLSLNSSSGTDPSGSHKSLMMQREDPYLTILNGCKGGLWKGEGNYRCTRVWRGKDGSSSSSSSGGTVPVSTISTRSAANTKKSAVQTGGAQSGTRSKQKKSTVVKSGPTSGKETSVRSSSTLAVPGLTMTLPGPSLLRMAYSQPNSPEKEETGKADTMDRLDPSRAIRASSESGMAESSKKRRRGSKEYDEDEAGLSLGERAGSSPPAKRQIRVTAAASSVVGKRISPRLSHAIPVRYENGLGSGSGSNQEDEGDVRRGRSAAPETGIGSGQPTDAPGLGKMLLRREVERKKRAATHSPPGGTNGVEGDVADEQQDASNKSAPVGMRRTLSHDTATAMRGEGELGMAAGRSRREVGPPRHLRDYEMEIAV